MRRAVLAIAVALSTPAFSQTAAGELAGTVVDALTLTPIRDALVVVHGPALPGEQSAVTDASGSFEMTFLPAGVYSLAVKCDGCVPFAPEGVVLKSGRTRVRIAVVPVPSTEAIAAGQAELMRVEKLYHLVGRSDPRERRKDEIKTILDLAMGLFVHLAERVAYQASRKL